jgi:hypothetical protein
LSQTKHYSKSWQIGESGSLASTGKHFVFQLKVLPDFILIIQAHLFNIQVRYPIATAVQTGLAQG